MKRPPSPGKRKRKKNPLDSKAPLIGGWLRRRAARRLAVKAKAGNQVAATLLTEAVLNHVDPRVRLEAAQALEALETPGTIAIVCARWAATRNERLEETLLRAGYIPGHPVFLRVLTALKLEREETLSEMDDLVVEPLLSACNDPDPVIRNSAGRALAGLKNPAAIEAFLRHVMSTGDSALLKIALESRFEPADPAERALFFFMTEQWEKYEILDFQENRPLLRRGYAAASEAARRVFLSVARRSGRPTIVSAALSRGPRRVNARDMELAEWEAIAAGLVREKKWEELWRLCFLAPVSVAAELVGRLEKAPWAPPDHEKESWEELRRLRPPEGKRVVLVPGTLLKSIEGQADPVHSLRMIGKGTRLAGAIWNTVRLWDIADGAPPHTLHGHTWSVTDLCVIPGERLLASASKDRTVKLWTLPRGNLIKTLRGHRDWVSCLAVNPRGTLLASGSKDSTVRLWSLPGGKHLRTLSVTSPGHDSSWVLCLAAAPDGKLLVSGSKDSSVRLWRLPEGEHLHTLEGHRGGVLCLAVSPGSDLLATGGKEGTVRLWDLPGGRLRKTLKAHSGGVLSLLQTRDGKLLATGGHDGVIRLWELPEARLLATLEGHTGGVLDLATDPRGDLLLSASSDCAVKVWSLVDGEPIMTLSGHTAQVRSLSVSSDGRIAASAGNDKAVRLWHLTWTKPLAVSVHEDLDFVRTRTSDETLRETDRRRWKFLEALLQAKFRYDIALEESVVSISDYDIEIETDG